MEEKMDTELEGRAYRALEKAMWNFEKQFSVELVEWVGEGGCRDSIDEEEGKISLTKDRHIEGLITSSIPNDILSIDTSAFFNYERIAGVDAITCFLSVAIIDCENVGRNLHFHGEYNQQNKRWLLFWKSCTEPY